MTIAAIEYPPDMAETKTRQESFAACKWLTHQAEALGISPKNVEVGGASEGGNLAAATGLPDPAKLRYKKPPITPVFSAQIDKLPPTSIIAAEHDVLLNDSRAFAASLKHSNVPCEFNIEPGVTHDFINRGRLVPSANMSVKRSAEFLRGVGQRKNCYENRVDHCHNVSPQV